ncbi:uncharacterized protein BT62DRAFT_206996 [Guyanagaster necrorhizus]|uniref:Uncharacterized protein n=1 Tax=Guyanagaster necrorhizus TaxID=856835 RepID=A0A9P7VPK1_9AGAR|nr:uncharacterized protein BT62DRAFT_206996 [Guyanagaster necrorhizus MCA 3950]KAG7445048.1 hypothetical protein BT62DRAFT_206996 [Guyanagaster necrorhizus MCA 3950]
MSMSCRLLYLVVGLQYLRLYLCLMSAYSRPDILQYFLLVCSVLKFLKRQVVHNYTILIYHYTLHVICITSISRYITAQ